MHLSASDYQALEASALFRSMSLEDLTDQLASCPIKQVQAGDVLLQPGHDNEWIYVLLDGELGVHLHGAKGPAQVRLKLGDCVGEMSLVDGQTVSAWVIAVSAARLLAIPHSLVWSLVDYSHGVARNLLAVLSGRVRHNNLTLVAAQTRSLEFDDAASVDALTGLHNRRWLLNVVPRVLQRCERDGQPLVLLLADIDRFMQFSEKAKPVKSDEGLRKIAAHLADTLRAQDMIARLVDDRFAILLTRTEVDESLFIAERLRETVASLKIGPEFGAQPLTLSCGLALHRSGHSFEALMERAESALLSAKQNGRDCVEAAS
jgi:diguanylate cyclase (GGDEF)-like protein